MTLTYTISADGTSITCHKCWKTSVHPRDIEYKYCGHCHQFHEGFGWLQEATIDQIKPLLVGKPPEFQGAILAELLAIFLAGHAPPLRKDMLKIHFSLVKKLIPIAERELFGGQGFPKGLS